MIKTIEWNDQKYNGYDGIGRNGQYKSKGVEILLVSDNASILLSPVGSKGVLRTTWQEIPADKLDEIIQALQEIRDDIQLSKK